MSETHGPTPGPHGPAHGSALDPTRDPDAAPDRLPRRLGIWSAAAVLVGSTIGSGIFRVPSTVAGDVGTVGAAALLWVVGGLVALFGALTIAELAVLFPRSGGIYVYLREAYGEPAAFLFGWTELLMIRPSAYGAIALIFADYLGTFVPLTQTQVHLVAAAAIAFVAAANYRSVMFGAAIENSTTAAKVLALVGVALLAFAFGDIHTGALAGPIALSPSSWGGFGVALIAVLWAYDGWADLTFMAGEVREPARTLPRALLGGTLAILVIYLAINAAYFWVLPLGNMAASKLVAADAAIHIFGQAGAAIIAALVMLSTFGTLNGSMMTGPRILFAMADDDLLFRPIARVHPKFRTPHVAIALAAALGILYVSVRSFEQLADQFILGIWPFYALAVGAVFIVRRRRSGLEGGYRTVGYPVVPLVFLLASVLMLANALIRQPASTGLDLGIILVGIPIYYGWMAMRRRRA